MSKRRNKNINNKNKPNNISLSSQIKLIGEEKNRLGVEELVLLEKAYKSDDPDAILLAARRWKDIEERQQSNRKSIVIDPLDQVNALGFKDKKSNLTYGTLRAMSKVPIVDAVLLTRIEQISSYLQPQSDKYSPGFIIRRKQHFVDKNDKNAVNRDKVIGAQITEFLLNCGSDANSWTNDNLDTFIRKIVKDSLTFDCLPFEVVRNRTGVPDSIWAVDGATLRIAASYDDDTYKYNDKIEINGYYPSYVQVIDSVIQKEFYPWEMCFGIRNPTSSIYNNGYGEAELEILISTVTSMLYADQYNSNIFRNGSYPKGIVKVSGDVNPDELHRFRQQWRSMIQGAHNSSRTVFLNSDKMEFIDMTQSNKDMEFAKFQEYLIRLVCAIYKIDPSEIGFDLGKGSGQKPLFEGNNEIRLKYSKDKGLIPLLKFLEQKINKYIVNPYNNQYEFKFVGIDSDTPQAELESDIKKLDKFMTIDEIRAKYELEPLGEENGGNLIASAYAEFISGKIQAENQEKMIKQQNDMNQNENEEENSNNGMFAEGDDNPFMKGFIDNWDKIMCNN